MEKTLSLQASAIFNAISWPATDQEEWRRTDLSRLLPKGLLDATASNSAGLRQVPEMDEGTTLPIPEGYAARIVTKDGRPTAMALSAHASEVGLEVNWAKNDAFPDDLLAIGQKELNADTDRISAWHWRDSHGALIIRLPKNAILKAPIMVEEHIVHHSKDASSFVAPHLHIDAQNSAHLNVVWSFASIAMADFMGTPLINAAVTGYCGENARLHLTVRQNLNENAAVFLGENIIVGRDGHFDFIESHLGGSLVKTRARVLLNAQGADACLKGLYVADKGQHMDIGTLQHHQSSHATSDALYKGVIRPGGRSIFQGLIHVAKNAAKTDAYLTNKNLLTGNGARADSIPQLDILTDDVKCSHGSTTGKLNPDELFYLQSRGFSPEEATRELTRGFLMEVFNFTQDAVRNTLEHDLNHALEGV